MQLRRPRPPAQRIFAPDVTFSAVYVPFLRAVVGAPGNWRPPQLRRGGFMPFTSLDGRDVRDGEAFWVEKVQQYRRFYARHPALGQTLASELRNGNGYIRRPRQEHYIEPPQGVQYSGMFMAYATGLHYAEARLTGNVTDEQPALAALPPLHIPGPAPPPFEAAADAGAAAVAAEARDAREAARAAAAAAAAARNEATPQRNARNPNPPDAPRRSRRPASSGSTQPPPPVVRQIFAALPPDADDEGPFNLAGVPDISTGVGTFEVDFALRVAHSMGSPQYMMQALHLFRRIAHQRRGTLLLDDCEAHKDVWEPLWATNYPGSKSLVIKPFAQYKPPSTEMRRAVATMLGARVRVGTVPGIEGVWIPAVVLGLVTPQLMFLQALEGGRLLTCPRTTAYMHVIAPRVAAPITILDKVSLPRAIDAADHRRHYGTVYGKGTGSDGNYDGTWLVTVRGADGTAVDVVSSAGAERPRRAGRTPARRVRAEEWWPLAPPPRQVPDTDDLTRRDVDGAPDLWSPEVAAAVVRVYNHEASVRTFQFDMLEAARRVRDTPDPGAVAADLAAAPARDQSRDVVQEGGEYEVDHGPRRLRLHRPIPPQRETEFQYEIRRWLGARVQSVSTTDDEGLYRVQFGTIVGVFLDEPTAAENGHGLDAFTAEIPGSNDGELYFCVRWHIMDGEYEEFGEIRPAEWESVKFAWCTVYQAYGRSTLTEDLGVQDDANMGLLRDAPTDSAVPAAGYTFVSDQNEHRWNWMADIAQPYEVFKGASNDWFAQHMLWLEGRASAAEPRPHGPKPQDIIARVFEHPYFYARVHLVQGNGQKKARDDGSYGNFNGVVTLNFGPHFAAFHESENREYEYEQALEHNIVILSTEQAARWQDEDVRTLHNATLAWKYSGRQKLMYEKRRWLMRQPEWVTTRFAPGPRGRTLERRLNRAATYDQDEHHDVASDVHTQGLGPARGMLWLHLPLLESAERRLPVFPVVDEITELVLVARARSVIESTRLIIPASVLLEILKTNLGRAADAEEDELNEDTPGGSAAFPHDCFFGWSAMQPLPLATDLKCTAAPVEAPPSPPRAEDMAEEEEPDDRTRRARARAAHRTSEGQAAAAAAKAAAAALRAQRAEVKRARKAAREAEAAAAARDNENDDEPYQPEDTQLTLTERRGTRYMRRASLARVQDTDPDGFIVTPFVAEPGTFKRQLKRFMEAWRPNEDGLYEACHSSLLLDVQMSSMFSYIGTRAHLRLAMESVCGGEETDAVDESRLRLNRYNPRHLVFAAADAADSLRSPFERNDGGLFVKRAAFHFAVGEDDTVGFEKYTSFLSNRLLRTDGAANLLARVFTEAMADENTYEAHVVAVEYPLINPFLMAAKPKSKRRCYFTQTQADFVIHMKREGEERGFVVMGDFKNVIENKNPIARGRVDNTTNVQQVFANARLFEAMTGVRVTYGALLVATRRPEQTTYVVLFPVRPTQTGEEEEGDDVKVHRLSHFLTLARPLGENRCVVYRDYTTVGAFLKGIDGFADVLNTVQLQGGPLRDNVVLQQLPELRLWDTYRDAARVPPPADPSWRQEHLDPTDLGLSRDWGRVVVLGPDGADEDNALYQRRDRRRRVEQEVRTPSPSPSPPRTPPRTRSPTRSPPRSRSPSPRRSPRRRRGRVAVGAAPFADGGPANLTVREENPEEGPNKRHQRLLLFNRVVDAVANLYAQFPQQRRRRLEQLQNINGLFLFLKTFTFNAGVPALVEPPNWRDEVSNDTRFGPLLMHQPRPVNRMRPATINEPRVYAVRQGEDLRRTGEGKVKQVLARTLNRLINERIQRTFVLPDAADNAAPMNAPLHPRNRGVTRRAAAERFLHLSQRSFWKLNMLNAAVAAVQEETDVLAAKCAVFQPL